MSFKTKIKATAGWLDIFLDEHSRLATAAGFCLGLGIGYLL